MKNKQTDLEQTRKNYSSKIISEQLDEVGRTELKIKGEKNLVLIQTFTSDGKKDTSTVIKENL
jgi:hypothetical protein